MSHDWYKFYPQGVAHDIDLERHTSIAAALEHACEKYADRIALTCLGADLTYRQLNRLANDFAGFLEHEAGLKKGDRLAIMLPNIMQFPIAFFAAQKLGVICVNTNPLYTPREMRHQFQDSGAKAIIIIDLFLNHLEQIIKDTAIQTVVATSIGDQLPAWKGFFVKNAMKLKGMVPAHTQSFVPFKDALRRGARHKLSRPHVGQEDVALLQYTGGTTGVSKGAMLLQRNVLANMLQIQSWTRGQMLEASETVLTALPLYHIFALTVNFLTFVAIGERMLLIPKPIPIDNVIKIFQKYPVTAMTGVNTLFSALVNNAKFRETPPKALKFAIAGGMALQAEVGKRWQQLTGLPLVEGFGLTEAAPVTHVNPLTGGRDGSIGLPVPATEAKIVDENGKEQPIGDAGELIVRGPQVMAGYWQRPDETAKTIKDGWLWTGDIARRDHDGFFYIVDRKKDMILVSGFNVFPNEVEGVLVSHPKVLEAAVVGIPDAGSGEAVKAYVVARDPSLTVEELRKHCAEQLTGYKRPRHFEFRESLPKTNVGKILRRELRSDDTKQTSA